MTGSAIVFRPMGLDDVGNVPISHQGDVPEVVARIGELGSSAILAFDGDLHVAQLQFRRHVPGTRSPKGLYEPLYWGDFGAHEPDVPDGSIAVYCFHVGQTDDTDARDDRYQGQGISRHLLDALISWADDHGIPAIVVKTVPPFRPVMMFMGGQSASTYKSRGFVTLDSWIDEDLRTVVARDGLAPEGVSLDEAARVSCCVRLRP